MNTPDLRPCPFCACTMPTSVGIGRETVELTAIFCPECGAIGPRASAADAPWHAEKLWNGRRGDRAEESDPGYLQFEASLHRGDEFVARGDLSR